MKYNQKEWQSEFNLNVYDYGARIYTPDAPRFWQIDPYAEKYETLSPYAYVANNPVNAIDPDGRLIVYVNGLLFGQAAEWKLNPINWVGHAISEKYRYNPNSFGTTMHRDEFMFNGSRTDYWGSPDDQNSIRGIINGHFEDNNNVFFNGSNHFRSKASDRFALGQKAGLVLIEQLKNGGIELANGETIKIVGHSQGAAYAAGMLAQLLDSEYADRLEMGIYLSPHQPGDFQHPDGVFGAQFSTLSDWVSSRAGGKGRLMNSFNGKSKFSEIRGVNFLFIRPNHDGGKGGHDADTWSDILQRISDFLNE